MVVGIQLDCRLKNVRISISIAPLKDEADGKGRQRAGHDRRLVAA